MNLFGPFEHCLSAILLCNEIISLNAVPITDVGRIEKQFLKHRSRVTRKLTKAGVKISKNYIEIDPVCGLKSWDLDSLCVKVAERLYPINRIAILSLGMYQKANITLPPETCIDGEVILRNGQKRKRAVHVKMFKCAMSNYTFEKGFEMGDFYLTSSSSAKRVYVLRDYYDESPLHEHRPEDELIMTQVGDIRHLSELNEYEKRAHLFASSMDSVSSASADTNGSPNLNADEFQNGLNTSDEQVKTSLEKVYKTKGGNMVLVRLYALVGGIRLKRIQMKVQVPEGKKFGFSRRSRFNKPPIKNEGDENHGY